jgi:trans-2,3-dihydro-3-hydroxyanthranilate isomerase
MLVPLGSRSALAALEPDFTRLCAVCDQLGLLGCNVYSRPDSGGRLAARMFAPSIRVEEDIANANSTACLAALLAGQGLSSITVDMGDALEPRRDYRGRTGGLARPDPPQRYRDGRPPRHVGALIGAE